MHRLSERVLFAVFFAGVMLAVSSVAATAATRYVATSGNDADNDCTDSGQPCLTIQYAVVQANAGDTVSVAGGAYHESLDIRLSLTLTGAGSSGSGKTTIDGDGSDVSILVDGVDTSETPVVTIQNMDVSGNQADDGVDVVAAQATIIDSVVSGNGGNGIDILDEVERENSQSAVQAGPQITVTNTVVSDNGNEGIQVNAGQATIVGCVVSRNGNGGVIIEDGSASIDTTTLDGNTGAGVVADGGSTQVTLTRSTVSNTVSFQDDEGDAFGGGVLVFPGGIATIDTATIFGNTGQGLLVDAGAVTVANSTISGTVPNSGQTSFPAGGVVQFNEVPSSAGTGGRSVGGMHGAPWPRALRAASQSVAAISTLTATIVAAQAATVPDCGGAVQDGGYNLDSDGSCAWNAAGSVSGVDPQLGALADNGGSTSTLLPAGSSAAVDAIPAGQAGCVADAEDQRSIDRPQPSGGACDIGAVEVRQVVLSVTVGAHGSVTAAGSAGLIGSGIGTCSDATCTASYEDEADTSAIALILAPDAGWKVGSVTGCGGSLSGNTYTTGPIAAACTVQVVFAQGAAQNVAVPALDRRLLLLLAAMVLLLAPMGLRRR